MKKKRLRYSRKRIFIGLFLFLFLVGIGLGYALVTTKLEIDGIVHVKDAKWDVHFTNFQEITGSVNPISNPTVSGTSISFSAKVDDIGDFYGFTIDVTNQGTINADISGFLFTPDFSDVDYIESIVEYSNGIQIEEGDILAAGKTKTIKVLLKYKDDLNEELYPIEDQLFNVVLSLDYEQYVGTEKNKIVLDSNGEDASVTPNVLKRDTGSYALDLPTPIRNNYTFDGWYTARDGGDLVDDNTLIDDDTIYYAHWKLDSSGE